MEKATKNLSAFLVPVSIVLAGIMVSGAIFASQRDDTDSSTETNSVDTTDVNTTPTLPDGSFQYYEGSEVEVEDGKPVIRLFSTTWCGHCGWGKETFDSVAKEYVDAEKILAYHWELDIYDNTLTETVETEVPASEQLYFEKFNPEGSIPTFVIGGKYFRVGNAFEREDDLAKEEEELRRIIEQVIEEATQ